MTLLRCALCVGCIAVVLSPGAQAQTPSATPASGVPPSKKTITNWLHSDDSRLVAWGAHDAMVTGDRDFLPELLSLATKWQQLWVEGYRDSPQPELSPVQKDQRDAMAAVLDALIQMKADVPGDTLRTLAPDFGNNVAILLARMPNENSAALSMDFFRSMPGNAYSLQYVGAALLALHPPADFAGDLLSSITVKARVMVVLPDSPPTGSGTSGSCMNTSEEAHEGWPLTGQYALSAEKSEGATLVVGGIDPIYFTRKESTRYIANACGRSMNVVLQPEGRRRLVAEMLGVAPEEIAWKVDPATTIAYQSQEQFDRSLLDFIETQQGMYRATADALEARNLLPGSELLQSLPKLELVLDDMRGQGQPPLPKDENLPARVAWSQLF